MYEKLPKYVKTHGRFCLWRYEQRNGKPTKVPYRTDGRRADSTKVSGFASFEDVLSVYSHGGYDGIGMMVYGDLSAIDIDHCVEDGELSHLAKEIADKMNSYTECLEEDIDFEVKTSAVYDTYRCWCADNGCGVENCRNFLSELRKTCTVVRKRPKSGGEKTTLLVGYKLKGVFAPLV